MTHNRGARVPPAPPDPYASEPLKVDVDDELTAGIVQRGAGSLLTRTLAALVLVLAAACGPDGNCANSPDSLDTPQRVAEGYAIELSDLAPERFSSELLDQQDGLATVRVTLEEGEATKSYRVQLRDVGLGDGEFGCSWEVVEMEELP